MAMIRIDLAETLVDGMDIKFKAPCPCSEVTGLVVYYPKEDDTIGSKELTFRDAHGNDLTGVGNLFAKDSYVKVIVDTVNGFAYLQNADNNGFLNSAIFGTYTHTSGNLSGSGENGKFKATVSGTISSINVNGVACSVKCGEDSSMDLIAGCWYTFIRDGNTVNFNAGGAGGGLNFKIVGGTSTPASPKENTIWINTSTAITGYIFSATQPSSPKSGLVWITVGASSQVAFNALKKEYLMVYPLSAKQYVSGAWVDRTAKSYQGNKWVTWLSSDEWLFDYSHQRYEWQARAWTHSSYASAKLPSVTNNSDGSVSVTSTKAASENIGCAYELVEDVDLTKYNRIEFTFEYTRTFSTASGHNLYLLAIDRTKQYWSADYFARLILSTSDNKTSASLDVSGVNRKCDIALALYANTDAGAGSHTVKIKQIKMV